MSDFFTRLAERTLGLALTIQPFKPSLFALEADTGPEMPCEPAVEDALSQSMPMYRRDSATPLLHPDFAQIPSPAHTPEIPGTVEIDNPVWQTGRGSVGDPISAPNSGLLLTKLTENVAFSQANPHHPLEQKRRRGPTTESFSPDSPSTQESPPQASAIESAVQPSNFNRQFTVVSQPHRDSNHESLLFQTTESRQNSPVAAINNELVAIPPGQMSTGSNVMESGRMGLSGRPSIGGLPFHTPSLYSRTQQKVSESTVQVTIGRVEVRAVTAPTTSTHSQQQPVKPPTMSLDEYLRRREQGGRR